MLFHNLLKTSAVANKRFGITIDPSDKETGEIPIGELRRYFRKRKAQLNSIIEKLKAIHLEASEITLTCITPKENEHLVSSLQTAFRKSFIFARLKDGEIASATKVVKAFTTAPGCLCRNFLVPSRTSSKSSLATDKG